MLISTTTRMTTRSGAWLNPIRNPLVCYLTSTLSCSTPDISGCSAVTVGGVEQTGPHRGDQSRNRSGTFLCLIGFDGLMTFRTGMRLLDNLSKSYLAQRNKSSEHLPRHTRIIGGITVNSQKPVCTTWERAVLVLSYWILQGGTSSRRTVSSGTTRGKKTHR